MRIKSLFTYRLIRVLRLVLPVVVVVLIAIPARNYWVRLQQKNQAPRATDKLPRDLQVRTDNFNFSKAEGDRTLFTIRARKNLQSSDMTNLLEDVDVTIYGKTASDPTRTVKSRNCNYDQQTQDIHCTGDVEVWLDDQTTARTEEVIYKKDQRRIVANSPIRFERPGSLAGTANTFEYSLDSSLLTLVGAVSFRSSDGVELHSGSAVFHQNENWATASDGVLIKSKTGWVRGDNARADLTPLTFEPRLVVVEGNVSSESSLKPDETWKLRSGWVQVKLSPQGVAQNLLARTNVELQKLRSDGNVVITGNEVEAHMNEAGTVSLLESRGDARMTFGADRSLRGNKIFANLTGGVATEGDSVLDLGDWKITGQAFNIQNGDIVTFDTDRRATMKSMAREAKADKTHARFDSQTNRLVELTQTGNFSFTEGGRKGSSNSATIGDDVVTLEGTATFSDAKAQVEARTIELNDKAKTQTATGNVKTLSKDSTNPMLVTSDYAKRTADTVSYTGHVHLFRRDGTIEADRLDAPVESKTFKANASGHVFSTVNNIRIWANSLDYDDVTHTAHYLGDVIAKKQDIHITAADMIVKMHPKDNAVSEITASQKVVVTRGYSRGTGDQAVYDAAAQNVVLTGQPVAEVRVEEQGDTTQAPRITVNVAGSKMVIVQGSGNQRAITKHRVTPPL